VYEWIWRRLPGGLPGKLVGSILLIAAAVLVLWFLVFPAVEDKLPFNDVTVEQEGSPGPPQGLSAAGNARAAAGP
jgi:hypothetical protein